MNRWAGLRVAAHDVERFLHGGGVLSKVGLAIDSNESTPTAASTFNYDWHTLRAGSPRGNEHGSG